MDLVAPMSFQDGARRIECLRDLRCEPGPELLVQRSVIDQVDERVETRIVIAGFHDLIVLWCIVMQCRRGGESVDSNASRRGGLPREGYSGRAPSTPQSRFAFGIFSSVRPVATELERLWKA